VGLGVKIYPQTQTQTLSLVNPLSPSLYLSLSTQEKKTHTFTKFSERKRGASYATYSNADLYKNNEAQFKNG